MSDPDSEDNSTKSTTMSVSAEPFVPRVANIPKSGLSVDAPEFIAPQSNKTLSPHAREFISKSSKSSLSASAQEFQSKLSVGAPEFVAGGLTDGYVEQYGYDSMYPVGPEITHGYYYDPHTAAVGQEFVEPEFALPNYTQNGYSYYEDPMLHIITELHNVTESLTNDPADFKCVESLVQLVSQCTPEQLQTVIVELFNQMLKESNFRYSGARICKNFHENLGYLSESFVNLLVSHCFTHYEGITSQATDDANHCTALCNFSLLLGELIVNMKDVNQVMASLPALLKDVLHQVLIHNTDEALGAVSLILKLTSGVWSELNVDIQDLLNAAKLAIKNTETPQAMLLNGVLKRYSKSPVKQIQPSGGSTGLLTTSSRAQKYGIDLEPIYYDHLGQEFSAEEKALMDGGDYTNSHDYDPAEPGYDGDGGLVDDDDDNADDGMDPEIEAAFDQFLRELDDSVVSPTGAPKPPFPTSPAQSSIPLTNGSYPAANTTRHFSYTYREDNKVMNRPDYAPPMPSGPGFNQPPRGSYATNRSTITTVPLPMVANATQPMSAWNVPPQTSAVDIASRMSALHIDVNQQQHLQQLVQMQQQYLNMNGNAVIGGASLPVSTNQMLPSEQLYYNGLTQHYQ